MIAQERNTLWDLSKKSHNLLSGLQSQHFFRYRFLDALY